MFGRRNSRSFFVLANLIFGWIVASDASAMPYGLEQEQGVGGGPEIATVNAASKQQVPHLVGKSVGATITIENDDGPVIRAAEGVPISPFGVEPTVQASPSSAHSRVQALVAVAHAEAEAAAIALSIGQQQTSEVVADNSALTVARNAPVTAQDLLKKVSSSRVGGTTTTALPNETSQPRPAARPLTKIVNQPAPEPIENAQFSPGTFEQPSSILSPRVGQESAQAQNPSIFSPPPKKPTLPAIVQPLAIAPNVAASPKASVLRQAPPPNNALVELVQPPTDYSLTVAAGTSQLLNSSQPVTNVIASDPNVANAHPISATQ
ncbi:MAG: hypothetical protein AAGA73_19955, partial [Pseudomonadota bacterium]